MSWRDYVPEPWTRSQRGVVLGFVAILIAYGAIRLAMNRTYIPDPQPASPSRASDLADRIDPNIADAPTLAVLPLIGDKRASDIVAYRQHYIQDHPGQLAFRSLADLLKIRGIGPATIDHLQPFLIFPPDLGPTSQPLP